MVVGGSFSINLDLLGRLTVVALQLVERPSEGSPGSLRAIFLARNLLSFVNHDSRRPGCFFPSLRVRSDFLCCVTHNMSKKECHAAS